LFRGNDLKNRSSIPPFSRVDPIAPLFERITRRSDRIAGLSDRLSGFRYPSVAMFEAADRLSRPIA